MTAALPLRSFLAQAKSHLQKAIQERGKVTLVIGNESADLDSMTSSVIFAYLRSMHSSQNAFQPAYIPVTNIPAADVRLRAEFTLALRHANVEPDALITLDDLPMGANLEQNLPAENTRWILVDHNALQGQLGKTYGSKVVGCVDHHTEENRVPKETDPEPRIITEAGSCTSLVVNYCQAAWDQMSNAAMVSTTSHAQADAGDIVNDSAFQSTWDAQVAQLALASILIDTRNMKDKTKVTEHDTKAVDYLEARIMLNPKLAAAWSRDHFYDEISDSKNEISHLTLPEIFRKDYKQWDDNRAGKLGVSSVVKSMKFLMKKAKEGGEGSFSSAIDKFAREHDLAVFAIMTHGKFGRELLVTAKGAEAVGAAKKFGSSAAEELGLEEWSGEGKEAVEKTELKGTWSKLWVQKRTEHSRKRVAPLLREAMM